jgi:hypothetical protein
MLCITHAQLPELYTRVALARNLPELGLKRGDLAWVTDYVEHSEAGETGAILEIFNILGESLRVVVVPVSAIQPLRPEQLPTIRMGSAILVAS